MLQQMIYCSMDWIKQKISNTIKQRLARIWSVSISYPVKRKMQNKLWRFIDMTPLETCHAGMRCSHILSSWEGVFNKHMHAKLEWCI